MAKVIDGEFRAMLGCRRSGQLSSPTTHAPAALGRGRSSDLKPIEEDLESEGVRDTDGAVSVDLKLAQVDDDREAGAHGSVGDSVAAISEQVPGAVSGDNQVILSITEEPMVEAVAPGGDGGSEADFSAQLPGDVSVASQVEPACLEDNPTRMADLVMNSSVVLGKEHGQEGGDVA
ncbi:hypothetical protein Dimus_030405 [Dionaea muscipula]